MSYESRVIIAHGFKEDGTGFHCIDFDLDLDCMANESFKDGKYYRNGWRELFKKPFEGEVYIEDGNTPTTEDKYGEKLKWATMEEVYEWCINHKTEDGRTYWKQEVLESVLKTMLFEFRNGLRSFKIIHYGH